MKLISNIQQLREEKRFSRPKLANKVGVSWETIKAYEVKGAYPSIQVAFKMAEALECKVDDLFTMVVEDIDELLAEINEEVEKDLTPEEAKENDDYMFLIAQSYSK